MPLFMEFHTANNVSLDDLRTRAGSMEYTEPESGVKHHHIWFNENSSTIIGLVEGPSETACRKIHRMIYGADCATLLPVEECFSRISPSMSTSAEGESSILVVSLEHLIDPVRENVVRILRKHGDLVKLSSRSIVCRHASATVAINVLLRLQRFCTEALQDLTAGLFKHPLHPCECEQIFAVLSARKGIVVDKDLYDATLDWRNVRRISQEEQRFLLTLLQAINVHAGESGFSIPRLTSYLGMSRPQLYRKIHALTGKSPHELLENARLARAVTLLEDETRNISEVSLELGYTNPSYFSKIFQLRYGCTPSHFK